MNVLSLFDGFSCGQLALKRAGVPYKTYFASEIDESAIRVAQHRFPLTVQLGDVKKVIAEELPIVDLLIGGSPCQGFSIAGDGMNFEDPRSALFFQYARLLKGLRPKWFLLENVVMKKEHQDVISSMLGVSPIVINSSLVSAQNRPRLYWTNLPVAPPLDRGVMLKDILCDDHGEEVRTDEVMKKPRHSSSEGLICVGAVKSYSQGNRIYSLKGKSPCLSASSGGVAGAGNLLVATSEDPISYRRLNTTECERLQTVPDGHTMVEGISRRQRHKMLGNGWTVDVVAHILNHLRV